MGKRGFYKSIAGLVVSYPEELTVVGCIYDDRVLCVLPECIDCPIRKSKPSVVEHVYRDYSKELAEISIAAASSQE